MKVSQKKNQNGLGSRTLTEIARLIGGELSGDGHVVITGLCGIKEARDGDLTFLANSKYAPLLETTKASAVITSFDIPVTSRPTIRTENPSLSFAKLASLFSPLTDRHPQGISPKASVAKTACLGTGVAVGPFVVIEDGARIGDRTVLYPGCYVGPSSRIGNDCLFYAHVSIREKIEIGHRVIVHSGTVIGSDGFGFATVKGVHHKIPQIGAVVIEDDVEIGANVTIDRARFGKTVIGKGTKIDNLVQIAHNVITGSNCIIVAQAGVSGSTILGNNVVLAGQSGIVGHVTVGDNVMVGAHAGVSKSIPPNTSVWGSPAKPLAKAKRINAAVQRLPELYKVVESLQERVKELEKSRGRE